MGSSGTRSRTARLTRCFPALCVGSSRRRLSKRMGNGKKRKKTWRLWKEERGWERESGRSRRERSIGMEIVWGVGVRGGGLKGSRWLRYRFVVIRNSLCVLRFVSCYERILFFRPLFSPRNSIQLDRSIFFDWRPRRFSRFHASVIIAVWNLWQIKSHTNIAKAIIFMSWPTWCVWQSI